MKRRSWISALVTVLSASMTLAGDSVSVYQDPAGDAVIRRTDPGADCTINPQGVVPDLLEVRIMGWQSPTPATDPYNGSPREGRGSHLFRIDVKFAGLINPPNSITSPPHPFAYGPSPVFGFLDIDIDRNRNTGGELGSTAHTRYLANVGRFGTRPYGSLAGRAVEWSEQLDLDFYTAPQFERSGADWALAFCGCHNVTIVSEGGNGNGMFDAGETWVVRSRFFKRSGGYQAASGMIGGSLPGLYDPLDNVRFSHDLATDTTLVSLVWAIDAIGAAQLRGESPQPYDQSIAGMNHASVVEGLRDLIIGANGGNGGPLSGPVATLTGGWANEELDDENLTDPTRWRINALFGMPCADMHEPMFIWTDTGFDEQFGDCNGDAVSDGMDQSVLQGVIDANDGGPRDLDGVINGAVMVGTGATWSYFDLNSNGAISNDDIELLGTLCAADFDHDGTVAVPDIFEFLSAWFAQDPSADIDGVTGIAVPDIFAFLSLWFADCP